MPRTTYPPAGLELLAGLDMRQWWEPTPEAFLNHVSKAQIAQAIEEGGSGLEASALTRHKEGRDGRACGLQAGRPRMAAGAAEGGCLLVAEECGRAMSIACPQREKRNVGDLRARRAPAPLGLAGQFALACCGVAALRRATLPLVQNHRYHFTTWRWGRWVVFALVFGYALKLVVLLIG